MGKCQILFCLRSASQLSAVEGKSIYRGIEKASISYKYKNTENTSKYILHGRIVMHLFFEMYVLCVQSQ